MHKLWGKHSREAGEGRGGVGFSNSRRIREEEGVGFRVTWRVAPSSWRTSLPRSGIGQEGMTNGERESHPDCS